MVNFAATIGSCSYNALVVIFEGGSDSIYKTKGHFFAIKLDGNMLDGNMKEGILPPMANMLLDRTSTCDIKLVHQRGIYHRHSNGNEGVNLG